MKVKIQSIVDGIVKLGKISPLNSYVACKIAENFLGNAIDSLKESARAEYNKRKAAGEDKIEIFECSLGKSSSSKKYEYSFEVRKLENDLKFKKEEEVKSGAAKLISESVESFKVNVA